MQDSLSICVLICTCNRPDLLRGALDSIVKCEPPPDRVVVVNGGDERADHVIKGFGRNDIPVLGIKTKNINLAVSRNIGLQHCDSDIIAMTDDDAEVFPDWIGKIKEAMLRWPDAGAVGGPVIGTSGHTLVGRVADLTTFPRFNNQTKVRTLPGVNIAYRKEVIDKVGSYDPDLFRGEDVDYNWRAIREGYTIWYDPAIQVYHHHRSTAWALIRQHYMYGRAYYRVRRKWNDMYSVYPHGIADIRDILRMSRFLISPVYEPALQSMKLGISGIAALPLLYSREFAWRLGMIQQMILDRTTGGSQ